jgi:hypothetical protein
MKKLFYTALSILALSGIAKAQNVGIGTATPNASAKLEITDANRGVLIPRIALTATNVAAPVTTPATSLLVYNTSTAGITPTNVTPGFYYWNGTAWVRFLNTESTDWKVGTTTATTNALTATGFLGTSTNQHIDLVSNNIVRGRLSNLGEFFIGTVATSLPGDLMNGVSNVTFPWAVNGYSAFNGSGTYGQVTGGTTLYAGVQGEYYGTNNSGAGVRGLIGNATAGISFGTVSAGVSGSGAVSAATVGSYKFGVYGNGGLSIRSGGVMGYDYGFGVGALGYYASNFVDYGVYGFGQAHTNGAAAGRTIPGSNNTNGSMTFYNDGNTELSQNTFIGLGIYGGVMGGWVRGLKYGFHAKGETYSLYVDGQGFSNKPFTYLMPTATGERVSGYMSAAVSPEVTDKGKVQMENGRAFVSFKENFKKVMTADMNELVITATPQGSTAGVFITQISNEGFWIYENNGGSSNVQISWMAVSPVNTGNLNTDAELLSSEFDGKMEKVMYNDNNTDGTSQPIWWDGTQMRWDAPPVKQPDPNYINTARPR